MTTPSTETRDPRGIPPMVLLESGIPLSLLLDLVCGPESADLLDNERPAAPEPRA